ncbi:MAG: sporulation integral membrane protein YtvI [Oscillospiraceae bacterium]|nr:sporulation integral membrane protein YtvI [Oscillospiraceae bacterium]
MIIDWGYWAKVIKKVLAIAGIILGIYLAIKLSIFYMPFLVAFILAILIEPIIRFVRNKTQLTRKVSAIIVMGVIFFLIISLLVWGIIILIQEASNLLAGLNGYYENINHTIQGILDNFKFDNMQIPAEVRQIAEGASHDFLTYISDMVQSILTGFLDSIKSIPIIAMYIGITLLAIYFMCADRIYIFDQIEHHLPRTWVKKAGKQFHELTEAIGSYLKAEIILAGVTFVEVLIGLYILKFMGMNLQYPLIAAILIGFVDALPILGSGIIMIPWAIIVAVNGDFKLGVALSVLWLVVVIVRQFVEPKVVSKQIGVHPIFTLIAMYTGFRFIGIFGLIVGPIILVVLNNVFSKFIDKGLFKSIFERK